MICSQEVLKEVPPDHLIVSIKDEHSYDSSPNEVSSIHNDHQYDENLSKSEDHIYAASSDSQKLPEMVALDQATEYLCSSSRIEVDRIEVEYESFAMQDDLRCRNILSMPVGDQVDAYTQELECQDLVREDDSSLPSNKTSSDIYTTKLLCSQFSEKSRKQDSASSLNVLNSADCEIIYSFPLEKKTKLDDETSNKCNQTFSGHEFIYQTADSGDDIVFKDLIEAVNYVASERGNENQIVVSLDTPQKLDGREPSHYKVMYHLLTDGKDLYFEDINDIMGLLQQKGEALSRKHISLCRHDESKCITIKKRIRCGNFSLARTSHTQKSMFKAGLHSYARLPDEHLNNCPPQDQHADHLVDAKVKALLKAKNEEIKKLTEQLQDREQRIEALTDIVGTLVEKISTFEKPSIVRSQTQNVVFKLFK